jgi:hypothetical protein
VGVPPPRQQALGLVRRRGGGEVQVGADPAEEGVPHRTADQRELVTGGPEQPAELEGGGRQLGEHLDRPTLQRRERGVGRGGVDGGGVDGGVGAVLGRGHDVQACQTRP